jgi:hypothetical protein
MEAKDAQRAQAEVLKHLKRIRELTDANIQKFRSAFKADPVEALSWGADVFESAARQQVVDYAVLVIEKSALLNVPVILEQMVTRALKDTRNPFFSTSPTQNIMKAYLTAAYADIGMECSALYKAALAEQR